MVISNNMDISNNTHIKINKDYGDTSGLDNVKKNCELKSVEHHITSYESNTRLDKTTKVIVNTIVILLVINVCLIFLMIPKFRDYINSLINMSLKKAENFSIYRLFNYLSGLFSISYSISFAHYCMFYIFWLIILIYQITCLFFKISIDEVVLHVVLFFSIFSSLLMAKELLKTQYKTLRPQDKIGIVNIVLFILYIIIGLTLDDMQLSQHDIRRALIIIVATVGWICMQIIHNFK